MKKAERIYTGHMNIDTTKPISVEQFKILQGGRDAGKTIAQKKQVQHIESQLQQDCVEWFTYQYPQYWLFSVKNSSKMGGKMVKGKNGKEIPLEAIIAKREGLRKGVADLQLLYGNSEHYSLFLELKTDTGSQSKEQKEFEAYCNKNKFKYVVVRSLEQFITEIKNYLTTTK